MSVPLPTAKIKKTDDRLNIVWAEVYLPFVPDTQGDFMSADSIRKMAYKFMENMRLHKVDENHDNRATGSFIVESFIARKDDPDFIEGAWVAAFQVTPELMEKIDAGEINGVSMEGMSIKEDAVVKLEVPEVIKGTTYDQNGHTHEFEVTFNDDNTITGVAKRAGSTPHTHLIKSGTSTEFVDTSGVKLDHNHRFSLMEAIEAMPNED